MTVYTLMPLPFSPGRYVDLPLTGRHTTKRTTMIATAVTTLATLGGRDINYVWGFGNTRVAANVTAGNGRLNARIKGGAKGEINRPLWRRP